MSTSARAARDTVPKLPTSHRFSPTARSLMKNLADKLGVSETAVIEMAVRRMAEREGVVADNED